MDFEKVLSDIKALKVQGAENIAKTAVSSLEHILLHSKAKTAERLYHELMLARNKLVKTRSTEPCMRNALNFVFHDLHGLDLPNLIAKVKKNIDEVHSHFKTSDRRIADIGPKLIKDNHVVYTHCHSSTVMSILRSAHEAGRKFEVHNTETRPLFQGRKTAEELAALGIPISHYIDSAMRLAIRKADICLLGADAVQANGKIINKIGSELVCETAQSYGVPVYVCTTAWKFDSKTIYSIDEPIEDRGRDEVWQKGPRKIRIMNPAFEKIDPKLVTGVISEIGVYPPAVFITEARKSFPWLWH